MVSINSATYAWDHVKEVGAGKEAISRLGRNLGIADVTTQVYNSPAASLASRCTSPHTQPTVNATADIRRFFSRTLDLTDH
jgi:hypothetical protein